MHLEPGGSEDSSSLPSLDVPAPPRGRGVPKADVEPGGLPRRDGLPKAYRMRHGRHYVEQLMGDAPLKTVRDVAVTEFHEPPDTGADLTSLQASIKDHGMLEPLVVTLDEGRYRIIGGAKRFRAALAAGRRPFRASSMTCTATRSRCCDSAVQRRRWRGRRAAGVAGCSWGAAGAAAGSARLRRARRGGGRGVAAGGAHGFRQRGAASRGGHGRRRRRPRT